MNTPSSAPGCKLLGIVNITRDSFSDGGDFLDPSNAITQARALAAAGATMIDLGPASSHPDAEFVSAAEEIRRLQPVVTALHSLRLPLSIDSFHPETQRWAAAQGVAALNDIQGFPDSSIYPDLAESACHLIVMHSIQRKGKATRVHSDPGTILDEVVQFFDTRVPALTRAGIHRERLILDPGMGFFLGSDPACSTEILRQLPALRARYGLPLLVSVSRKSFLRRITGCTLEQVGPPTLAAELYCVRQGADWIRTHDVKALADAMQIESALCG